jgi:predicted nucleic-acid-binding protein
VTERIFVDASVFLRFLVRDMEGQYAKARALFEQAERGTLRLETTVLALVELTRALEHDWGMTRGETLEVLEAILDTRNLRVPNHAMVREAVELYGRGGMDFPDACTTEGAAWTFPMRAPSSGSGPAAGNGWPASETKNSCGGKGSRCFEGTHGSP